MDTADQLLERVARGITRGLDKWQAKKRHLAGGQKTECKQNADSLQVQEASSQLIGGHGQEAH